MPGLLSGAERVAIRATACPSPSTHVAQATSPAITWDLTKAKQVGLLVKGCRGCSTGSQGLQGSVQAAVSVETARPLCKRPGRRFQDTHTTTATPSAVTTTHVSHASPNINAKCPWCAWCQCRDRSCLELLPFAAALRKR